MTVKAWTYILNRYINGGYFSSAEGIAASVTPGLMYYKNAGAVMNMFERRKEAQEGGQKITLEIPVYDGANEFVKDMMKALEPLKNILHSAYVHGSLATGEENRYSDFDGLLILRDDILTDRAKLSKAAAILNNLRFYMHRQDPLQHHGWFVLSETDLTDYHEDFLPVETMRFGKAIFPAENQQLTLHVNPSVDFTKPFFRLCRSIERKLVKDPRSYNLYSIKAILSEFMMLPSLFIQAMHGKGIFKKFSFEEMRKYFAPEDFDVMDRVSAIRAKWSIELTEKEMRFLERTDFYSWYRRKHIHYKIPSWLSSAVDEELFISMRLLTVAARKQLEQKA